MSFLQKSILIIKKIGGGISRLSKPYLFRIYSFLKKYYYKSKNKYKILRKRKINKTYLYFLFILIVTISLFIIKVNIKFNCVLLVINLLIIREKSILDEEKELKIGLRYTTQFVTETCKKIINSTLPFKIKFWISLLTLSGLKPTSEVRKNL